MQVDVYSTPLVRLRDLLLGARALEGVTAELVTRWDGQAAADSAAAAILELTYIEVARALVVRLVETRTIVTGGGVTGIEVLVPRTRIAAVLAAVANDAALSIVPASIPLGG